MCCAVTDVGAFQSFVFPIFSTVYPTGFYKNPLALGKLSLAFTLQMQGKIVKSRGIFSKSGRDSQHKWVENVWETTLLSVVDATFYDARKRRPPDMTNTLLKTTCTRAYRRHRVSFSVINKGQWIY